MVEIPKSGMNWDRTSLPSLSRQLAVSLGLTVISVLAAAFVISTFFSYRYHTDQLEKRANELIDDLAGVLEQPLWNMNIETLHHIGDVAYRYPFLETITIELVQKDRIQSIYSKSKESHASSFLLERSIHFRGIEIGRVHMGITTRSIQEQFYSFLLFFGIMLLIILASIYFSSRYFIKKHLQAPFDQLNTVLHAYASGNYRLSHESFSNREFERIGSVLYHMGEMTRKHIEALSHADRLLKNLNEMVFRLRLPEGNCDYVNPAVERVLGYPMETVATTPNFLGKVIHPEDKETYENLWNDIVIHNRVERTYVYRIIDPTGAVRWIHQSNNALRNDEGAIVAIEGCCTDITRQKEARLEQKRLEAQLRQSQKMEAIGSLAGGIAHDFNNILGIIMGNVTLAAKRLDRLHPARKKLDAVETACRRGKKVVSQILKFSNTKEFDPKPMAIDTVLSESIHLIKATLSRNIAIQYHARNSLPWIKGDATQLHQVVINIATNAIHAMELQGGTLHIESLQTPWFDPAAPYGYPKKNFTPVLTPKMPARLEEGGYLQISFLDMGVGIDPAIQDKVLNPYFTTKGSDRGTGLGLPVVHGIVKKLDGYLFIESAFNVGTCVSILFPALGSEKTLPASNEPISKAPPSTLEDAIELLFVDDETMMLEMTCEALTQFGYNVTCHTNAKDALEIFRDDPLHFDLLISDMNMPEMSGLEFMTKVLSIRPDLPIIICSGDHMASDIQAILAKGHMKFFNKPYDIHQLSDAVLQMLGKGKSGK